MGEKLVITLDKSTTSKYLELARKKTEAEVNADCMPSGCTLIIHIIPGVENVVMYEKNEIGSASVDFVVD